MRDIREDLQERLEAISADRAALQKQIDALASREASLKMMLAEEESRIRANGAGRPQLPFDRVALVGGMQITDLIKATLRNHRGRLRFEEVKDQIENMPFDFAGQKPGRVIHGGLLSLMRTKEVDKDKEGRYGIIMASTNGFPVQGATQ
jgi:hypothetical protein